MQSTCVLNQVYLPIKTDELVAVQGHPNVGVRVQTSDIPLTFKKVKSQPLGYYTKKKRFIRHSGEQPKVPVYRAPALYDLSLLNTRHMMEIIINNYK